jgi:hypothetical protein
VVSKIIVSSGLAIVLFLLKLSLGDQSITW